MSVEVSMKNQFIFGLILLLIVILIIEGIGRIVIDQKDSCIIGLRESKIYSEYDSSFLKELCYNYKSIIDYEKPYKHLEPNQKTSNVNINSFGIRGDEFYKEKEEGKYRIITVGGSAMYGVYATSDKNTIPGFLQEKFINNNEIDIEVINGGVNGADSFDETNLLKDKLLSFKPDMIIVYDGGNDLFKPIHKNNLEESWPSFAERFFKQFRNYYKTPQFLEFIDRVFKKNIYGEQKIPGEGISKEDMGLKAEIWKNRWKEMCIENNDNRIKTIIVIQPYLGVGNKKLSEWEIGIKNNWSHNDVSDYYPLMIEKLYELDSSCSKTIDLTHVFDSYETTIFYDLIHVGDLGNKIVADEIFSEILSVIGT